MSISKGFRYKDEKGKVTDYEYGVNGSNVTQDANHRLVTDEEKKKWNGKADPEDIPSGSAASYSVANNDTTTQAGFVADARIVKQHGDEIDQLSSEIKTVNVYVGSDGKLHFVNSGGADSVLPFSQKATITFTTELHGSGWAATRIAKPDDYSKADVNLSRGSGSIYGYKSDDSGTPYGTVLGTLTTAVQTFDVSEYTEIGIRVDGNNSNAKTVFY